MKNTTRYTERGNAIWFIMVAIVLLGLLTAVLSRGGSTVDQSGDVERLRIQGGQILRYAKGFESAFQQMKLQGISENDVSFENTTTVTDYTNANCDDASDASYPTCLMFGGNGGAGLNYRPAPTSASTSEWIFTGANNVGTTADPVGTTAATFGNDLLVLLPNINPALCEQINRDLDVDNPGGNPPIDAGGIDTTAFTGAYPGGGPTILDGDPAPFELDGQSAGCFLDQANGIYYFYSVIIER